MDRRPGATRRPPGRLTNRRVSTSAGQAVAEPAYMTAMSTPKPAPTPFTAAERELLRRELCRHFGQDPLIADGLFLRTWRGGERRGQPKIPPAVQTMLDRGLLTLQITKRGPRALFTAAGAPRSASCCSTAAPWTPRASAICGTSSG